MGKLKSTVYAIIIILIIVGIALLLKKPTTVPVPLSNAFVIQLTDPPLVPAGTQSLVIGYSNLQLHEAGASNSTGFINVNQSGTVNLLELINFTQTIGVASIKPNTTFNLVRFNITSAKIEIDNTTYNVSVPNNRLTVRISNANSSAKGVLIDIMPSVIEVYSANQTIFVMVPSARAVVVGASLVNSSSATVGYKARKAEQENKSLESIKPNISIVSASLSYSGNTTTLTAEIKNNGNSTVTLKDLMVFGYMQTLVGNIINPMGDVPQMPEATGFGDLGSGYGTNFGNFNVSELENAVASISESGGFNMGNAITGNLSKYGISIGSNGSITSINTTELKGIAEDALKNYSDVIKSLSNSTGINITAIAGINAHNGEINDIVSKSLDELQNAKAGKLNSSEIESIISNMTSQIRNISRSDAAEAVGASIYEHDYHHVLNFIIMPNATLSLPFDTHEVEGPNGYNLTAGSTVTLTFSGVIGYGPEDFENANAHLHVPHIVTLPLANQTYSIKVMGEDGAFAEANLTAT